MGRIFWTNVVEHMRNPETQNAENSTSITDRLSLLRAKELIFQYGDLEAPKIPEFIFKNTILHNVTYESVLLRLRPVYHLQAAEGLIAIGGERVNEYAGRVGEHYEQAGELLKAAALVRTRRADRRRIPMSQRLPSVIIKRLWNS